LVLDVLWKQLVGPAILGNATANGTSVLKTGNVPNAGVQVRFTKKAFLADGSGSGGTANASSSIQ
jgi:hypothetical protein